MRMSALVQNGTMINSITTDRATGDSRAIR